MTRRYTNIITQQKNNEAKVYLSWNVIIIKRKGPVSGQSELNFVRKLSNWKQSRGLLITDRWDFQFRFWAQETELQHTQAKHSTVTFASRSPSFLKHRADSNILVCCWYVCLSTLMGRLSRALQDLGRVVEEAGKTQRFVSFFLAMFCFLFSRASFIQGYVWPC